MIQVTYHRGLEILIDSETGVFHCPEVSVNSTSLAGIKKKIDEQKPSKNKINNVKVLVTASYSHPFDGPFLRVEVTRIVDNDSRAWIAHMDGRREKVRVENLYPVLQEVVDMVKLRRENTKTVKDLQDKLNKEFNEKLASLNLKPLTIEELKAMSNAI